MSTGGGTAITDWRHDATGALVGLTHPGGTNVDYAYDAAGQLESITVPGGAYAIGYDMQTGRRRSITTPAGDILAETYDGALFTGSTWTGAVMGSVTETHDAFFRVTDRTVNGVGSAPRTYDDDHLLRTAGAPTLDRDPASGLVTGTTLGMVTDTRTCDVRREERSYTAAAGGVTVYGAEYTVDDSGRVASMRETIGGVTDEYTYSYDAGGRLGGVAKNAVATAMYTGDDNDNLLSRDMMTGTYDARDRVVTFGNATYVHGDDGARQSKTAGADVTRYHHDALGQLTRVELPDGTAVDYVIDWRGRRVGKKVNGVLVQGLLHEDQLRPIAELDANSAINSRFVYAARSNVPEYMVRGTDRQIRRADHEPMTPTRCSRCRA